MIKHSTVIIDIDHKNLDNAKISLPEEGLSKEEYNNIIYGVAKSLENLIDDYQKRFNTDKEEYSKKRMKLIIGEYLRLENKV